MVCVHITCTEICPVDRLFDRTVHADLKIAGIRCQREEHIKVCTLCFESDRGIQRVRLPAFGAELVDSGRIVAGPRTAAINTDLIAGVGVFYQHRVCKAVEGHFLRQRGVRYAGDNSLVQNLGLQIVDQEVCQQCMSFGCGMDMILGPDVLRTQTDGGRFV